MSIYYVLHGDLQAPARGDIHAVCPTLRRAMWKLEGYEKQPWTLPITIELVGPGDNDRKVVAQWTPHEGWVHVC